MLSALRRLETDGRMNQSLSSRNQQGDLNWVLESWDRSSGAVGGGGGGGFLTRIHHGGELDNAMLAAAALPHNTASWSAASGAGDGHGGEPKAYISPNNTLLVGVGGPRQQQPYYNNNSLAMPSSSPNLAHNHHHMMGGGSCSVPLSLSALESHHQHHHHHQQQQHYHQNSSLQPLLGFTNIPGVVPSSSSHVDFIRSSFEQQQQQQQQQRIGMYSGILDMGHNQLSLNSSSIKREDVYGDGGGYGRIGLNLGVRTYFSTEDMLAARLLGKRPRAGSPVPMCQAQGCKADLRMAKHYHRRHKVCEMHSKASTVTANGQTQRFCQQCSRFHALTEFDEGKRSCRKRLADHNRRRRKPQTTNAAAASTTDEEHQSETSTKVNNDMANTDLDLKKNSSTSASDNSDGSVKLQNSSSAPATTSEEEEKIVQPQPPLSESELGTGTTTTLLSSSQHPQARIEQQQQHSQALGPNLSLGGSADQPHSSNPDADTWLRKRDLASITSNSSVDFNRLAPQSSDQQQEQPLQSCSSWQQVGETGPRFHWYS